MPRAINKLTARAVATAGPGRFGDGAGLYLIVDPGGSKRWMLLFRHGGRQREMGLGSASVVSLADARRRRDETRQALLAGRDPIADKRQAETPETVKFGDFADRLVPELAKGFRNAKHAAQWTSTLKIYAGSLREKPVVSVSTDDVLAVLQPIWNTKCETADRVRGRIERVLDAAKAKGLRTGENPARWRGHLDQLLAKHRKLTRGHHAAMPFEDVPAFVATLRRRTAVSAVALEFTILTATRTSEVLDCPWSEIDRKARLWIIPAARMKAEREHRVPLSSRAFELLDQMEALRRSELVFPSFRANKPLSDMAMLALLKRMGTKVTVHGFRSSFRDWAGETTAFPREVAEAALAHAVGDETERAYRRGDALEKRRILMNEWADFVSSGACE